MLKTGRKCKWEEIEVGEVFAFEACWCVFYKVNDTQAMLLGTDQIRDAEMPYFQNYSDWLGKMFKVKGVQARGTFCFVFVGDEGNIANYGMESLYKLPKSVQRLWKEE